jgi:hypothetical protein
VVQSKVQLHQGASKLQAESWQMLSDASSAVQSATQSAAASAARLAQQGAQQASSRLGPPLRDGTIGARRWTASQLEDAADYTTSTAAPAVSKALVKTVAPRVSETLRSTARQVSPPGSRFPLHRSVRWAVLAAAILAGAGAAGTLVWRRYRTAMAADTEADVVVYAADDPRDVLAVADTKSGADSAPSAESLTADPPSSDESAAPSTSAW